MSAYLPWLLESLPNFSLRKDDDDANTNTKARGIVKLFLPPVETLSSALTERGTVAFPLKLFGLEREHIQSVAT